MSHEMDDLVSVIIPTYNRATRVCEAIDSALAQTHPRLEILVIDDGSTDNTSQVIQNRYGNDSRVRYLKKENGGVSSARNLGLKEFKGNFLAFLDSDDLWLPHKIALQLECLKQVPEAGMVWSDMDAIDVHGALMHTRYLKTMYLAYRWFNRPEALFSKSSILNYSYQKYACYSGEIFSKMILGNLVHTSTVLLTRERALKTGIFREDYRRGGEDYDFHLRTCKMGPVCFVDDVTVKYTIGAEDALTHSSNNVEIAKNFIETLMKTLETEKKNISLPRSMIRECLSSSHSWIGREYLVTGEAGLASGHFISSLKIRPWRVKDFIYLLVCYLPDSIRTRLISHYRNLRHGSN